MSRQIPSDILEPVLAETLTQLERQAFNFETLADAQTEDDHGVIICDVIEIAELIVVLVTFDHSLDRAATFEQCVEQALIRGWPDYSRRALCIFRDRIACERRRYLRLQLQSTVAPAELFRSQLECARFVANQSDLPLLHATLRLDHLLGKLGRELENLYRQRASLRELDFPIVEEED